MSYAAIEIKILQWSEARKIIPNSNPEYRKGTLLPNGVFQKDST